jgi:hypothetical protein
MKSNAFTCRSKVRFATQREAERVRLLHEETIHVDKGEMTTYRCANCNGFHNGHGEPRSRKAERAYLLQVKQNWNKAFVAFTIGGRLIESGKTNE